jgi:hypothetical protein
MFPLPARWMLRLLVAPLILIVVLLALLLAAWRLGYL